jgi:hypothetical protein
MTVAEYCYINRLAPFWRGRDITDHALPGDEPLILRMAIRRARARDEWWNPEELEVYMCMRQRLHYDNPWCMTPLCSWCGNQWDRWP